MYLKGKTQLVPDWVTQVLGTLERGTRESSLKPDPDPARTRRAEATKLFITGDFWSCHCVEMLAN